MLKDGIYEQILNQEIRDQLEKIDPKPGILNWNS